MISSQGNQARDNEPLYNVGDLVKITITSRSTYATNVGSEEKAREGTETRLEEYLQRNRFDLTGYSNLNVSLEIVQPAGCIQ